MKENGPTQRTCSAWLLLLHARMSREWSVLLPTGHSKGFREAYRVVSEVRLLRSGRGPENPLFVRLLNR